MNLTELKPLIAQGESDELEVKKSTGQQSRAMESPCAKLNGKGGSVIFGVRDDGEAVGQEVSMRSRSPSGLPPQSRICLSRSTSQTAAGTSCSATLSIPDRGESLQVRVAMCFRPSWKWFYSRGHAKP